MSLNICFKHQRLHVVLVSWFAFVLLMLSGCGSSDGGVNSANRPVVSTNTGLVMGVTRNGVDEYRGIPYGQAARWELATAQPAWSGVLDASNFGPACAQQARFDLTEESTSEDCLFLNVSAPISTKSGAGLPVVVWMPGGAFVGGGGQLYRLDQLARDGKMVVVSINYRLGIFGFMAHPAISAGWNGNLGLEDQRLAMRWVKDNIAQFGGDPNNVTMAGESAGAGSACMHLMSGSQVAGLFDKAIVQSAGCLHPMPTLATSLHPSAGDSSSKWYKLARLTGCAANPTGSLAELNCMKNIKGVDGVKSLLTYQGEIAGSDVMGFGPSIASGTVPLPDYSDASITQYLNRVPILFGGTQNELRLYVAYDNLFDHKDVSAINAASLKMDWLSKYYPGSSGVTGLQDQIMNHYFPTLASGGIVDGGAVGSMLSDYSPAAGINNCDYVRTASVFGAQTPLYQWEFADPDAPVLGVGIAKGLNPDMSLGAVHSSELNYLFPKLSNTAAIDAPDLSPDAQRLADILTQVWASFAKTGIPTHASLPQWIPSGAWGYAPVSQVMRFQSADQIQFYDAYSSHQCAFWRSQYPGSLQ